MLNIFNTITLAAPAQTGELGSASMKGAAGVTVDDARFPGKNSSLLRR